MTETTSDRSQEIKRGPLGRALYIAVSSFMLFAGYVLQGGYAETLFSNPFMALLIFGPQLAFAVYFHGIGGCLWFLSRILNGKLTKSDGRFISQWTSLTLLLVAISTVSQAALILGHIATPSEIGYYAMNLFIGLVYALVPPIILLPLTWGHKPLRNDNEGFRKIASLALLSTGSALAAISTCYFLVYQI